MKNAGYLTTPKNIHYTFGDEKKKAENIKSHEDFISELANVIGTTVKRLELYTNVTWGGTFIVITNNGYGRSRIEFLKFGYDKMYDLKKIEDKLDYLKRHIQYKLDDISANKHWGDKIESVLRKQKLFSLSNISTREHEDENTITFSLNEHYNIMGKFKMSTKRVKLTIITIGGKTKIEYDYNIDFNEGYGKEGTQENITLFPKGLKLIEDSFSVIVKQLEKLIK